MRSLQLGLLVFAQYALLAADIRFIADANYMGVAVVNICITFNTWFLTRRIIEARSSTDRCSYVIGGTAGALVAVLVT